jgi:hypothetical protein
MHVIRQSLCSTFWMHDKNNKSFSECAFIKEFNVLNIVNQHVSICYVYTCIYLYTHFARYCYTCVLPGYFLYLIKMNIHVFKCNDFMDIVTV